MSGTFIRISENGTMTHHHTDLKGSAPYEPLRALVGGFVERVRVRYEGKIRDAYVNENGIAERCVYNGKATSMLHEDYRGNTLHGPCVIWVPDAKEKKRAPANP